MHRLLQRLTGSDTVVRTIGKGLERKCNTVRQNSLQSLRDPYLKLNCDIDFKTFVEHFKF